MKKGSIYIGTSGWHYKHWLGRFYPEGIKEAGQLSYYIQKFKSVELNNSFYRLPSPKTFSGWRKTVPSDFLFAVKGSRYITHMKKLNVERENIQVFFDSVKKLREKLGPILFQLPPKWKLNIERFEKFLRQLPKKYRYSFEFRNHEWYDKEVYALLKKHKAAFCIYELDGHLSPKEITADFIYIRLHGPGGKYSGNYKDPVLKKWARDCLKWKNEGRDVYVYFDNDQLGYAAFNALRLISLVEK
jgi:uncharacterized protein YecE (DUF72 family)